MALPEPYPKDIEKLVREVSATTKIHDIKEYYKLKDRLDIKWWESAVVIMLFISGFGFIFTMIYLVPAENKEMFFRFLAFWTVLLILSLVATVEFLISKIKALRRLYDFHTRLIEQLRNELETSKEHNQKSGEDREGER